MSPGHLSKTAAYVAVKFYGLTQWDPYQNIFGRSTVEYYHRLTQCLPGPFRFYHPLLRSYIFRSFLYQVNEHLLPGDPMHILGRKWFLERMLDKKIDQATQQVIVLGSGFDHLAWRSVLKGITALEVDTPAMINFKEGFYKRIYPREKHPEFIRAVIKDDGIWNHLERSTADPTLRTTVVAEGFFDYLHPDTVSKILGEIQHYFTDVHLITTHFALNELSTFRAFVFRNSVRLVGEELKLNLDIHSFKSLLKKHKLHISCSYTSENIQNKLNRQVKKQQKMLDGFYILSAKNRC